ncbi:hypothetical protein SAMN05421636_104190 [Pricia antarctica]|uniref:LVIVD repeat-containing protein n=1 Tax=Pricia antarctica TaxID=641691 RepID=A0A1G7BJY5_9FLAO|nr:hypothetical protein [Pricia antarctica]SDE27388.1 hypothetical protein SAMN05421636_104190 [Pricia antarctica]
MKKVRLMALAAIFIISCSDETTVYSDASEDISMEGSKAVLESSILYDDAGVLQISSEDQITGKTAKGSDEEQAGDYPLTLIARVDAPSYSGAENLGASHVHVDGDYAYVSYNTVEDGYAGAIDVVYVGDPTDPRLTSRLYYTNADINAVEYNDGYIYAVGGVDSEKSVRATSNSFLVKIPVSNGRMDTTAEMSFGFQEGFNATDVKVTDNSVIVSSGKDGYLTSYKKSDLSVQTEAPFADLRSITIDNGNVTLLDGSSGVSFLDATFNVTRTIAIDSDFGNFAKRTLAVSDSEVIVSEGSKGAGIYNKANGSLKEYLPIVINPEGVAQSDIVTNAVALNENILFMANGGAGLSLSEIQGNGTDMVGVMDLNGSVNFVASKGDYIFAASGKEGLQIVKLNRPDATLTARCADLPHYKGSANLNVNNGETAEYSGSKSFNQLNINGTLLLCGSWTVKDNSYINNDGIFEMKGALTIGRNNKQKNIAVNSGATLRIEGELTIYGDLILNEGARLEFVGNNSTVNIFGKVQKSNSAEVKGKFNDIKNKF